MQQLKVWLNWQDGFTDLTSKLFPLWLLRNLEKETKWLFFPINPSFLFWSCCLCGHQLHVGAVAIELCEQVSPFAYQLLLIPSAVPEVHSSANQKPLCMTGDFFTKSFLFIQLFSSLQVKCSVPWLMGFLKFLTFTVCTNTAAGVQKHVLDVQEGNLGRGNMVMAIKLVLWQKGEPEFDSYKTFFFTASVFSA